MELNKKANWVQNPTRKNVILYIIVTSISSLFILLANSNFFTENPFKWKYTLMYILLFLSIFSCVKIVRNYKMNK
jgi:hypothetical protein